MTIAGRKTRANNVGPNAFHLAAQFLPVKHLIAGAIAQMGGLLRQFCFEGIELGGIGEKFVAPGLIQRHVDP